MYSSSVKNQRETRLALLKTTDSLNVNVEEERRLLDRINIEVGRKMMADPKYGKWTTLINDIIKGLGK